MADTLGQSSDRSASTTRNVSAALGVLVLALAPQLVELLWSFATIFGVSGRNTLQVLSGHGAALLLAVPSYLSGANGKGAGSDTLLALIYSYPLFAVAILSLLIKPKGPSGLLWRRRLDGARSCSPCGRRATCRVCAGFPSAPVLHRACSGYCCWLSAQASPSWVFWPTARSLRPTIGGARCSSRCRFFPSLRLSVPWVSSCRHSPPS